MISAVTGLDLGKPACGGAVRADDPRRPDVIALLERHLEFSASQTPPEHSFALDAGGLADPAITFFSYRDEAGRLLGVGALKNLGDDSGELKSMHTAAEARGKGIGRAILAHIIGVARERELKRLYLETGTTAGFAPARGMYESAGFI